MFNARLLTNQSECPRSINTIINCTLFKVSVYFGDYKLCESTYNIYLVLRDLLQSHAEVKEH